MGWSESDFRRNRDYFLWKLQAIKQRADVVKAIEQGPFDFMVLDTRGREALPSAILPVRAPPEELDAWPRTYRKTVGRARILSEGTHWLFLCIGGGPRTEWGVGADVERDEAAT